MPRAPSSLFKICILLHASDTMFLPFYPSFFPISVKDSLIYESARGQSRTQKKPQWVARSKVVRGSNLLECGKTIVSC
ncbi:hypothetical protein VNO77_35016 [Canavalia gladiata]|uniref:Uncharacterized protein n=1 Tax=Canavalia gladiata TaxID=3824 RepID=A0AAN9KE97_CANGL